MYGTLSGTEDIAEYFDVSPRTVRRYINRRGLPATLIRGTYYTTVEAVDKWLKEQVKEDTRKRMACSQGAKKGDPSV